MFLKESNLYDFLEITGFCVVVSSTILLDLQFSLCYKITLIVVKMYSGQHFPILPCYNCTLSCFPLFQL